MSDTVLLEKQLHILEQAARNIYLHGTTFCMSTDLKSTRTIWKDAETEKLYYDGLAIVRYLKTMLREAKGDAKYVQARMEDRV